MIVDVLALPAAQKQTPLGIVPFWEKPGMDPPLKREKRKIQAKLALLAKENMFLDILLGSQPEHIKHSIQLIYENTISGGPAHWNAKDWLKNAQLKMNCENRCPRRLEIGIMCGDKQGDR